MNNEYVKDFDSWNKQAKALNDKVFDEFFHEREIWWCALGVNIGSEQDGKNELFERPVLIIKKINSDRLFIAPITSKITDDPYRVLTYSTGQAGQILLLQARVISSKRLLRRVCRIKEHASYKAVTQLVTYLLKSLEIETPP